MIEMNFSSSKVIITNDSLASQNETTLNNQVENANNEQYQQQISSEEQQFIQIDKKFIECCNQYINRYHSKLLPIYQKHYKLHFILKEIHSQVVNVDNDVQQKISIQVRNIFNQYNCCIDEFIRLNDDFHFYYYSSLIEETKKSVSNTLKQLDSIRQDVYYEANKKIIWIDLNDSQENKNFLLHLQNQYKTSIAIKYYSNIDVFKHEFPQFAGQPLFLILSGQVANDHAPTDGNLFNWLKEQQREDKLKMIIKGIVIFTSDVGVKYMKDKFMNDPSKLVRCVTSNAAEVIDSLNCMISSQI